MQDVSVARVHEYRVPLPPLLNVMYLVRNTKVKGVMDT
jgi:hypothetical protein